MRNLQARLKNLEKIVDDNTVPEAIPLLMPKSREEIAEYEEKYKGRPYLILTISCASKQCDTCDKRGGFGCRYEVKP